MQAAVNVSMCREEFHRFIDAHPQYITDRLVLVPHVERLRRETLPTACIAGNGHIRQKAHFDPFHTLTFTLRAAPACDIERKSRGCVPAHFGFGRPREKLSNVIPESNIR